jgi:hypothetical protein
VLRINAPHRYVAWLAMLAMAFIVVMPVVSRLMPITDATLDGACPVHAALAAKQSGSPHTSTDTMERCGYCFLLSYSPLLGSSTVVPVVPVSLESRVLVVALPSGRADASMLSADPRGPPGFV